MQQRRISKNAIIRMRALQIYPEKARSEFSVSSKMERETNKKPQNLHASLRGVLRIGQMLGLLPLLGISSPSPSSLKFEWKSWGSLFWLIPLIGTVFIMLMLIYKMILSGSDLYIMSTFIFHTCKLGITLSFLHVAKCWPKLMAEWAMVEKRMSTYGWPNKFDIRVKIIVVVILTIAAVQYIINQISNLLIAVDCVQNNKDLFEYFYKILRFPYIFAVLDYSIWNALLLQIVDLLSAFIWCYVDLLIMVLSAALALRFRQVTSRLEMIAESKITGENTWRDIREDYNRLSRLCRTLDDCISYILLMSFGSNLFFILIQLFNSLLERKTILDKVYFFFSFGFLISRTVFVSLYAAWVNDESKTPMAILNSIPSSVYNLEIRRFIQQVGFDSVALTGRNFFSVTRGLILSVAGAIVTYELVLIQFNDNLLKQEMNSSKCSDKYVYH